MCHPEQSKTRPKMIIAARYDDFRTDFLIALLCHPEQAIKKSLLKLSQQAIMIFLGRIF